MYHFRTLNKGTWDLQGEKFKLGNSIEIAQETVVRFEPQLPYLYLPNAYYEIF